jgi:aminoglycoside phosphotransferase (APT) family kinase protein
MGGTREYSKRLGAISDEQFEAVAERWKLGRFLRAEPITSGLFGQNVFVITSRGEFVLRGAPHWVKDVDDIEYHRDDRLQFTKEKYFAGQLAENTRVPAPWPMFHDEASDIFGWPYLVMPRMPGTCFNERTILEALEPEDRRGVAIALGEMLAEMQKLTSPFAGDFRPASIRLEPFANGSVDWTIRELRAMVRGAKPHGILTDADTKWIDEMCSAAAGSPVRENTYVHCDYKLNNLTVMKARTWHVSGLFDFHEARFGDGTLDLVRQSCSYLESDRELASVFIAAYRDAGGGRDIARERMELYVVNDRMKLWAYFGRPENQADWVRSKTFRGWAERYLDKICALL